MTTLGRAMTSVRWAVNTQKWVPSKSDWVTAARCIQPEEKDRIGKFVFQRDAKSSMIGRLMLRKMIHKVAKIPYPEIQLSRTDKGKPYLQNDLPSTCQNLSFNVSHQGEYVVLAAETESRVGVDVMNCETPRSTTVAQFFHTMRRQFTDDEWNSIRMCDQTHRSEMEQLKTFYRLWCLKESYVKALGIGIGFEVQRLNFRLVDPLVNDGVSVSSTRLEVDGMEMSEWRFEETCLDNHCVAVAVEDTQCVHTSMERAVPIFDVFTFEELISDISPLYDPDDHYGDIFMKKDLDPFTQKKKGPS